MEQLTPIQQETLDCIVDFFKTKQRMPTLRELMKGLRLKSPCPVQARLYQLKIKGLIDWNQGKARSLRLTGYRVELVAIDQEAA